MDECECECDGYLDVSRHLARGISCLVRTANGVQCSVFCVRSSRAAPPFAFAFASVEIGFPLCKALHGTLSSGGPEDRPRLRIRRGGEMGAANLVERCGPWPSSPASTSDVRLRCIVASGHCTLHTRPRGVRRERPRAPHGGADENGDGNNDGSCALIWSWHVANRKVRDSRCYAHAGGRLRTAQRRKE